MVHLLCSEGRFKTFGKLEDYSSQENNFLLLLACFANGGSSSKMVTNINEMFSGCATNARQWCVNCTINPIATVYLNISINVEQNVFN